MLSPDDFEDFSNFNQMLEFGVIVRNLTLLIEQEEWDQILSLVEADENLKKWALILSSRHGSVIGMHKLIHTGIDLRPLSSWICGQAFDTRQYQVLEFLATHPEVDWAFNNDTLIKRACAQGDFQMVHFLLEGPLADCISQVGDDLLGAVLNLKESCDKKILVYLLNKGVQVRSTALMRVIEQHDLTALELMWVRYDCPDYDFFLAECKRFNFKKGERYLVSKRVQAELECT